jgi:hypothetical protein
LGGDALFRLGLRCGDSLRTVEYGPRLTSCGEAKRLFQCDQTRSRQGGRANTPGTKNRQAKRGRACCKCRSSTQSSNTGVSGEWRVRPSCATANAASRCATSGRTVEMRSGERSVHVRNERTHSRGEQQANIGYLANLASDSPGRSGFSLLALARSGSWLSWLTWPLSPGPGSIWLLALLAHLASVSWPWLDLAPGSPGS